MNVREITWLHPALCTQQLRAWRARTLSAAQLESARLRMLPNFYLIISQESSVPLSLHPKDKLTLNLSGGSLHCNQSTSLLTLHSCLNHSVASKCIFKHHSGISVGICLHSEQNCLTAIFKL
uniref:Uncharacterized protein n=1 Tax=Scleropages formosus TaxID=113540 RepID=A0A8C9S6M8_SCLFO